jgi:dihydropteroate synthase
MIFRARQFEFDFPRPALVMGIVNVTPDSFADGGKFFAADAAVAHALNLVAQGAEMLDIGGESTRPGAVPVSEAEELRRVIPVIEKLSAEINSRWGEAADEPPTHFDVPSPARGDARPTRRPVVSIDTMKPGVARTALAAGASIVNDVAANRSDDAMWRIVSEFHAGYIVMHVRGSGTDSLPVDLHAVDRQVGSPSHHDDVIREAEEFFQERLEKLNAHGILSEQIIFDPGIGFGKTLEQNLALLANLRRFTKLARPLLLGVSRKSFIGKLLGAEVNERLPASLACATLAVAVGVPIIRTHDVAETVQAVRLTEALLARKDN